MTFKNTGVRVPLEALAKTSSKGKEKYEQIMKLQRNGKTLEEIAPLVGYADNGKGSVSKFIKSYEEKHKTSKTLPTKTQASEQETEFEEQHNELPQQET